eukprot:scaffold245179_cov33-Tisochrysis_lutea.AAC.3
MLVDPRLAQRLAHVQTHAASTRGAAPRRHLRHRSRRCDQRSKYRASSLRWQSTTARVACAAGQICRLSVGRRRRTALQGCASRGTHDGHCGPWWAGTTRRRPRGPTVASPPATRRRRSASPWPGTSAAASGPTLASLPFSSSSFPSPSPREETQDACVGPRADSSLSNLSLLLSSSPTS